jgi:LysM repeat protein
LQIRALAHTARTSGLASNSCSEAAISFGSNLCNINGKCQSTALQATATLARTACVVDQDAEQHRMQLQRTFDNSDETIDTADGLSDLELELVQAEQAIAEIRACTHTSSKRLHKLQRASCTLQQLQRALQLEIELQQAVAAAGSAASTASSEVSSSSSDGDGLGLITIDLLSSSDVVDVVSPTVASSAAATNPHTSSSGSAAVQEDCSQLQASQQRSWRVVGSPAEDRHKAAAGSNSPRGSSAGGSLKNVFMAASAVRIC